MRAVELKKGIFWVGGIDWDLRNFHGYLTQRGSTYNTYLIIDKKIVLVDTVKEAFTDEMITRLKSIIDPAKIDYIVSNHVEMDHSGGISKIMDMAPQAQIVTSPQGQKGLEHHFKKNWRFHVVKTGDTLNIGRRVLHFVQIPMVHWPDSMVTYIPEDKLLLSNDAFGQHLASAERFDDEVSLDIVFQEAAKYYANIVLPYNAQVKKALAVVSKLDVDMIAPSHGVIWRRHLPEIIKSYQKWSGNITDKKAVIIYDTMWGSTKKIAAKLQSGLESEGIMVNMRNLQTNHISDIITDLLYSKLVLIGSPTLNNGMLPTVGAFLTYLRGLCPKDRIGFVFGSYGWGGQAVKEIEKVLNEMQWNLPLPNLNLQYIPQDDELAEVEDQGRQLAKILQEV